MTATRTIRFNLDQARNSRGYPSKESERVRLDREDRYRAERAKILMAHHASAGSGQYAGLTYGHQLARDILAKSTKIIELTKPKRQKRRNRDDKGRLE